MEIKLLNQELGNADLFLVDLILKGFFNEGSSLLDAGCGEGRNLPYFLKHKFNVFGIDQNYSALMMLKITGRMLNQNFDPVNFIHGDLKDLPFNDDFFDYILCFSVLHFVDNQTVYNNIFKNLFRVMKKEGRLILGMDSVFGMEKNLTSLGNGRYQLQNGETRYLLEQEIISSINRDLGFEITEPIKTHIVHQKESISYLVLKKRLDKFN
jgi:tellurite methyltransferase